MEKTKKRGFEVVSTYVGQDIQIPQRATTHSAGYDFCAAVDICVPSMLKQFYAFQQIENKEDIDSPLGVTLVPTGIKAYMPPEEYLLLANRSSNPIKHQLVMPNGVGIIDGDYYENEKNEGEIYFQFINYGAEDYFIQKGERIGQGIFMPFLKAGAEETPTQTRAGGFGSSGR